MHEKFQTLLGVSAAYKYLQLCTNTTIAYSECVTIDTTTIKRSIAMLTFKQRLVRQHGTTELNITPKIVTKSLDTTPAKTRSRNS